MSVKSRLQIAEQAAGAEGDPIIFIVRWGDDDTPIEDMPETISQGGKVHRYGINTIPEHLRGKPGQIRRIVENRQPAQDIQLAWPEDE